MDTSISCLIIDRNKKKIKKEILDFKKTKNHLDLTENYKTLPSKTVKYTINTSTHGTFSRMDYKLGI